MTVLIISLVVLWLIASQLIARMFKPANDDDMVTTWASVFLAPVAILFVLVLIEEENAYRFIRQLFGQE